MGNQGIPSGKIKSLIKDALMTSLYKGYNEQREATLQNLIQRNKVLQQTDMGMFMYKGDAYGIHGRGLVVRPKLHPELIQEMDAWLYSHHQVMQHEQPFTSSFFVAVLNMSDSPQDWTRLLPDHFSGVLNSLSTIISSVQPSVLTDDVIELFLRIHQDNLAIVKQRLATNLIQF